MKKLFFYFLLTILLTSCGSTTTTIPDDATVAECPQGKVLRVKELRSRERRLGMGDGIHPPLPRRSRQF